MEIGCGVDVDARVGTSWCWWVVVMGGTGDPTRSLPFGEGKGVIPTISSNGIPIYVIGALD